MTHDRNIENLIQKAQDTLEEARLAQKNVDLSADFDRLGYDGIYDEVPNRFTWQDAKVLLFLMREPVRLRADLEAFIHNSISDAETPYPPGGTY